jgi:Fe-S cluster assembly scaffold protein SufB
MPFEATELYKRYVVNFPIPKETTGAAPDSSLDALKKQIILESRLKFDLTNDKGGISAAGSFVKIVKKEKMHYKENANGPHEERLGNYIVSDSDSIIEVDVPNKKEAKLNFLLLCGNANMPLEIVVNVGEGSRLSLFEWFGSASASATTMASLHVVNAAKGSDVEINILHNENTSTSVGALNRVTAGEKSKVRINAIYNGGNITRSTTFAEASGKESDLLVNELVFGHAEQKLDVNTFILNSNELTRAVLRSGAVLKGKSFCILKGYAKVEKNTKGSYSNVEEKGLVMDPDARIQPLPDMSIDCKDVAFASHSAATAPVDKEALFYLMSRGIDEAKAKRIFVASFLSKYLADIENNIVKEIAISILLDKLDNDRHASVPRISLQNMWIVPSYKR